MYNFITLFILSLITISTSAKAQVINYPDQTQTAVAFAPTYDPISIEKPENTWNMPSDHLPIGATLGNVHIAFWNILNKNYLNHIEEDTQGLRDSLIITENYPISQNSSLTSRELISINIIMEMINHPTHPRSMIALEEVHKDVVQYLNSHLTENWVLVNPPGQKNSQDIFLYDNNVFELIQIDAVKYNDSQAKTIFTITLKEKQTDKRFRFVQSHIPGGPTSASEGREKFALEAMRQYDPDLTVVLMGDMNASPRFIETDLNSAAEQNLGKNPYTHLPVEYPTHVNTDCAAAWFDHFFISSPDPTGISSNRPEELCERLVDAVEVLKDARMRYHHLLYWDTWHEPEWWENPIFWKN